MPGDNRAGGISGEAHSLALAWTEREGFKMLANGDLSEFRDVLNESDLRGVDTFDRCRNKRDEAR